MLEVTVAALAAARTIFWAVQKCGTPSEGGGKSNARQTRGLSFSLPNLLPVPSRPFPTGLWPSLLVYGLQAIVHRQTVGLAYELCRKEDTTVIITLLSCTTPPSPVVSGSSHRHTEGGREGK